MPRLRLATPRMLVVAGVVLALQLQFSSAADAAPADFTIGTQTPKVVSEGPSLSSVTVDVSNLTNQELTFTAAKPDDKAAKPDDKCAVKIEDGKAVLAAARTASMKVEVRGPTAECTKDGYSFTLAAAPGTTKATVTADPPASPNPSINWLQILLSYLLAFAAAAVFLGLAWIYWLSKDPGERLAKLESAEVSNAKWKKWKKLRYLEQTFSFKDSWASNVTLVVGLLTAVVGSTDILKAINEKATTDARAEVLISSAIALAVTAIAPVLVQMARMGVDKDETFPDGSSRANRQYYNTVLGLMLGAVATVGAAGGQAWILSQLADSLDLGGLGKRWFVMFAITAAILLIYANTNLRITLTAGMQEPPPKPESDDGQPAGRPERAEDRRRALVF